MITTRRRAMMSSNANMPFVTFVHTIPANIEKTITLTFSGQNKKVYIQWGDGNAEVFLNSYITPQHTYVANSTAREVTVKVITYRTTFTANACGIISIDTSRHPLLESLSLRDNELRSVDISHNPALKELHLDGNKLTTLDISHNKELTSLYLAHKGGSNNISSLDISNNPKLTTLFCYMDTLTEIIGLDGLDRTIDNFQITTQKHQLTADFDLSGIRLSKYGLLALATTGSVKVAANVNRTRKYNVDYKGSKSWGNWQLVADSIEVTFEDGFATSDYAAYIRHLAEIVQQEKLYHYPQGNSWNKQIVQTYRDLYSDFLILRHDSYYGMTWSNFESNAFGGTNVIGILSKYIDTDKYAGTGDFYLQMTYAKDAAFFFGYVPYSAYGVIDTGHPRFKYDEDNGLVCTGDMEAVQATEADGYITTLFKVTLPDISYFPKKQWLLGVLESSYPSETDRYISKITSIQLVDAPTI